MSFESMSLSSSPPYRRLSTASTGSKREEDLINAYEAEEERIINVLSRKLEQLREEKISLERTHEEESEAHVNRLARELAILRLRQHQQAQAQAHANGNGVANGVEAYDEGAGLPVAGPSTLYVHAPNIVDPNTEVLLAALKKENESLRGRLVVAERDYVRVTRLNEIYREELIEHRRRLGLPVDNLIGLSSVADAYSQPTHRRTSSTASSSPTASMVALPTMQARPSSTTHSMPIPRQTSQVRRSHNTVPSISETPLSNSPSSAESPYLSPMMSTLPESFVSNATNLTTPPSSASLQSNPPAPYPLPPPSLSYPSVPPPSLSSSLGSPVVATHMPARDGPPSPVDPLSRRGSLRDQRYGSERRVAESGNLRDLSLSRSRRASIERGARVAETGSLVRSRAGSATAAPAVPTTTDLGVFVPSLDETLE